MRVQAIRGRNLASLEGEFSIDFTEEPLASAGIFADIRALDGGGKIHVAGCHVPRPFLPYAANGAGEGE